MLSNGVSIWRCAAMAGAMIKMLAAYGLTLVAFAAIDAVWLINMAPRLYKPEIGEVMMENGFRLTPAMIFYAIYIGGIVYFAVWPGLTEGVAKAAALGENGHLRLAGWREGGSLIGVCLAAVAPVALRRFGE